MAEPIFDHERLDVYRLSIEYVAFSYDLAKTLAGSNRHARDQWLRAAQSIPLNIAEGNGKHSLKDKNRFFEIARGSALECVSIHDVLRVCDVITDDANQLGKTWQIDLETNRIDVDSPDPTNHRGIGGTNRVRVRVPSRFIGTEYEYEPSAES